MRDDVRHERDLLTRGEARDQIIELKYKPDVLASVARQRAVVRGDRIVIAKVYLAARWIIEPAENVQEHGLPAAQWPEDRGRRRDASGKPWWSAHACRLRAHAPSDTIQTPSRS